VDALPAYVTVPDGSMLVSDVRSYKQMAAAQPQLTASPASASTR